MVKDKPKIDLAIFFDYNSDVVGPKAIKAVTDLGVALRSDALKGATIMLNGHTDAAGSRNTICRCRIAAHSPFGVI